MNLNIMKKSLSITIGLFFIIPFFVSAQIGVVDQITIPSTAGKMIVVGDKIYASNPTTDQVSIIDTANDNNLTSVSVGDDPGYLFYYNNRVYVANFSGKTVSVIDTTTDTVTQEIPIGSVGSPKHINQINGILFVAKQGTSQMTLIDTNNSNATSSVIAGSNPQASVAIGNNMYVGNYNGYSVSKFDGTASFSRTNYPTVGAVSDVFRIGTNLYASQNNNVNEVFVINNINGATSTIVTDQTAGAGLYATGTTLFILANNGGNSTEVAQIDTASGNTVTKYLFNNARDMTFWRNKAYVVNSSNIILEIDYINKISQIITPTNYPGSKDIEANSDSLYSASLVSNVLEVSDLGNLIVSPTNITINEGATQNIQVRLSKRPYDNVVLSFVSSDTAEITVSTSSLIFTKNNWNNDQTITLNASEDATTTNDRATTTVSVVNGSSDVGYRPASNINVLISITDNDVVPVNEVNDNNDNSSPLNSSGSRAISLSDICKNPNLLMKFTGLKKRVNLSDCAMEKNKEIINVSKVDNQSLLKNLLAQVAELKAKLTTIEASSGVTNVCIDNSGVRDLTFYSAGEDVKFLQTFLINNNYPIAAGATGLFVNQTTKALTSYQRTNSITKDNGNFGCETKNQMKSSGAKSVWW